MIKQFAIGLVWSLVAIPGIAEDNPKLAIWLVVGMFISLALLGFYGGLRYALERRAIRRTLERLLSLDALPSSWDWSLPAPESYMLLRGVGRSNRDAFKLGLLQLMATGVLISEDSGSPETGVPKETMLRRGSASMEPVTGSLTSIFDASSEITVKEMARKVKREYGSLDGFATKVVLPELVEAGLYSLHPTVLTPEGERLRDELETRMARYLREMRLQVGPVGREPRQALMTAVIGVAVGRKVQLKEAELQLVGKQVGEGAELAVAPDDTGLQDGAWLDWYFFNQVNRYFQEIDSGVNEGESGGDGADGIEVD